MLTIEEVIETEKLKAVINCDLALTLHTDDNIFSREAEICRHNAEYHEQIAEWLSELNESRREVKNNDI